MISCIDEISKEKRELIVHLSLLITNHSEVSYYTERVTSKTNEFLTNISRLIIDWMVI